MRKDERCSMDIKINFHSHALLRLTERGASEKEIIQTIIEGERFSAKFGRTGFRHNFSFESYWHDRYYANKQVEAFAVEEVKESWLVITVIVRYF